MTTVSDGFRRIGRISRRIDTQDPPCEKEQEESDPAIKFKSGAAEDLFVRVSKKKDGGSRSRSHSIIMTIPRLFDGRRRRIARINTLLYYYYYLAPFLIRPKDAW